MTYKKTKLVYGHGINDADYNVNPTVNGKKVMCKFYRTWRNMLERCHSHKLHERHPTYKDCTVAKEWLSFMNFKMWMDGQEWEGNQLDKDIIHPNNKHYSPKNCVFVSSQLNSLLNDCGKTRGKNPIGVSLCRGKFKAEASMNGNKKYLGVYATQEEAHNVYAKAKSKLITEIALTQTDARIKSGLLKHAGAL